MKNYNNEEFRQQLHKEIIKMRNEYKRHEKKKEDKKQIKDYEEGR